MSGILHSEERDYKTAYSYFFESFEGFNSQDATEAITALKYMLLCKIMTNVVRYHHHHDFLLYMAKSWPFLSLQPEEVAAIVQGKTALRYPGAEVDAMRAVAKAHSARDLRAFEDATKRYPKGSSLSLSLFNIFFFIFKYTLLTFCLTCPPYTFFTLELVQDPIVHTHLSELYNTLLEQVWPLLIC